MINSNELMIGCWVNNLGDNEYIRTIFTNSVHTNKETYVDCEKLEGIPITPEILMECGFENPGSQFEYLFKYIMFTNTITPTKMTYFTDKKFIEISRSGIKTLEMEIKYVHQLQILFLSLTQTHLKIEL